MTKKEKWIGGMVGTLVGLLSGVAGTAYALGLDKQKINDRIDTNSLNLVRLEKQHEDDVKNIMDGIDKKLNDIRDSLTKVETRSNDLQVSIKVVEAIIQRIEDKMQK